MGGKSDRGLVICDGKTIYNKDSEEERAKTREPLPGDLDRLRGYLARVGIAVPATMSGDKTATEQPKDFDLDKAMPVTDFKLGWQGDGRHKGCSSDRLLCHCQQKDGEDGGVDRYANPVAAQAEHRGEG